MYVRGFWTLFFVALIIAFSALALYGVWVFWPSENPNGAGLLERKTVHFLGWDRLLSRESLFFVMVAFAGALGGMVHSVRSLAVYVGSGKLKWSWTPFYLLKPVLGAVLATLLYFVLRAGLFSPSASTEQASPYGFAAIAALAGLFSDQAVEKLRVIAEELFQRPEVQTDHYTDDPPDATTGEPDPNPTPTGATVTGTLNAKGQETTYYWKYGPSPAYGSETAKQIADAGMDDHDVDETLTGLTPATTYHYCLVATNKAGTTQGDDRVFSTAP